jgi:hypothetical protein
MRMITGAICLLAGVVAAIGAAMSSAAWATYQKMPAAGQAITFEQGWLNLPLALLISGIVLALLGIILILSGFGQSDRNRIP